MEALKDIKAVVMDKTGTLTRGNFVATENGKYRKTDGKADFDDGGGLRTCFHPSNRAKCCSGGRKKHCKLIRPKEVQEISGKGIFAVFPEGRYCAEAGGLWNITAWMYPVTRRRAMERKCL